jgi:hypothetical protein
VASLSTWEYGSYLYRSEELEVHFHSTGPELRQQRWLELIKDYELEVHYHLGKANVVTDALSCKAHCNYLPDVRLIREESST